MSLRSAGRPKPCALKILPIPSDTATAAPPEPDIEDSQDLETFTGLGELVVQLMEQTGATEAETSTAEAETEDDSTTQPETLDFTATASPEQEALSRAAAGEATGEEPTELHPADYARQQVEQLSGEAPAEDAEQSASNAEDYARQQLAALQAEQGQEAPPSAESDAAAIARQQVEQLSGAAEAPASPEADLAAKFRDTEDKVRALRQQYHNGQITREQLQTRLREYLILDNNDQWWMMGVDTNTWYRYDNAAGDWVVDTPPVPLGPRGGPPTATSQFTPDQVLQGNLPYLPDDEPQQTSGSMSTEVTPSPHDTQAYQSDMPLPQQVPTYDPDMTMVGRSAIDQNTTRFNDAETLDSSQYQSSAPTVRATPVDIGDYAGAQQQPAYEPGAAPSYSDVDDESRIFQQALERQRQSNFRRLALLATLMIGGLFIIGIIAVLYMVVTYNGRANLYKDQIAALATYTPPFQSVKVLDSTGSLIAEISSEQGGARTNINLDQMSPELIFAIVGAEDPQYFNRPGFDPFAVAGTFIQGGSGGDSHDIARQVARMVIANSGDSVTPGSLDEIVVASEIARQYGRNFILQLYLNNESFGNQAFGVEAASRFYFDTSASDLNLTQGAMLAALLEDEVANDPVPKENRKRAFDATDAILRKLATVGCLSFSHPEVSGGEFCVPESTILRNATDFSSQIVVQRAELQTEDFHPRSATGKHPHFVDYVRRQLIAEYGDQMFRDGFQVYTTLDSGVQDAAEQALKDQLAQQAFTGLQTGAVMAVNPTDGSVLAMVGSPDFNNLEIDGQTNNVLTWQLPGATMLPVLYSAALSGQDVNGNGVLDYNEYLTPATILFDLPPDYQDPRFPVTNGDSEFRGSVSLRTALANNLKPPAIRAYQFVGAERYIEVATNMGLRFSNNPPIVDLGTAVGATTDARLYDMMQVYSVLANTGQYVPLKTISRITTADNEEVPLTGSLTPPNTGAITPSIAFLIQNIMSDQSAFDGQFAPLFMSDYPNRMAVRINYLNDNRDMWAIGFSRKRRRRRVDGPPG